MKNEVYSLLSTNKIEKALGLLFRMAEDKDHFKDLIIQSSFYYELKRRYRNNQITYDQYILHSNRIVNNLIEITELIQISNKSTNLNPKYSSKSKIPPSVNRFGNSRYASTKYVIVTVLLVVLAFSCFYFIHATCKENKASPQYATIFEITTFDKYVYHDCNR